MIVVRFKTRITEKISPYRECCQEKYRSGKLYIAALVDTESAAEAFLKIKKFYPDAELIKR